MTESNQCFRYLPSVLSPSGLKNKKLTGRKIGFFSIIILKSELFFIIIKKFNSSNIWPLRAFSPSGLFSLGERQLSKNSDIFSNAANGFLVPWPTPFLENRSLFKKNGYWGNCPFYVGCNKAVRIIFYWPFPQNLQWTAHWLKLEDLSRLAWAMKRSGSQEISRLRLLNWIRN